jgi:hypothetical protein
MARAEMRNVGLCVLGMVVVAAPLAAAIVAAWRKIEPPWAWVLIGVAAACRVGTSRFHVVLREQSRARLGELLAGPERLIPER